MREDPCRRVHTPNIITNVRSNNDDQIMKLAEGTAKPD